MKKIRLENSDIQYYAFQNTERALHIIKKHKNQPQNMDIQHKT